MFFFVKTYKASTLYKFTLFKGTVCAISSYPPCKEDPIEERYPSSFNLFKKVEDIFV